MGVFPRGKQEAQEATPLVVVVVSFFTPDNRPYFALESSQNIPHLLDNANANIQQIQNC